MVKSLKKTTNNNNQVNGCFYYKFLLCYVSIIFRKENQKRKKQPAKKKINSFLLELVWLVARWMDGWLERCNQITIKCRVNENIFFLLRFEMSLKEII